MLLLHHVRIHHRIWRVARHRFLSTKSANGSGTGVEPFRILFCGSDEFSVASLKAVHEAKDLWTSIDVIVPAERQVGRGGQHARRLEQDKYVPALRKYSEQHSLPLSSIPAEGIKAWSPPNPFSFPSYSHLLLTASFGHIIPQRVLSLFPEGNRLNVHPSLLPRWRGAAPVQWTIARGDSKTGVSVQKLVRYGKGIDSGDIVGRVGDIPVPPYATYNTLLPHLAEVGGDLLVDVLRRLKDGTATFTPQDEANISLAPKITHNTAKLRWVEQDAASIDRLYRGIHHQTSLWTTVFGTTAQLHQFRPILSSDIPKQMLTEDHVEPGTALLHKEGKSRRLLIACAGGSWLEVGEVQMSGKKALPIKDWWNGLPKIVRDSGRVSFE